MYIPFLCPMCNNALETIIHTLRDYPKVQLFWNSLSLPFQSNLFYGMHLVYWLKLNCKSPISLQISLRVFSSLLLSGLFGYTETILPLEELPNQKNPKLETLAKATEFMYLGMNGKQIRAKKKIQVQWLPPYQLV